ncbi:MAG: hypothetical protein H0W55_13405 [Actinobacteria bacterium]|nr:hypothetical protein [Rubrobacter sp.]MBA3630642.1 hypothetical protein [Actinomycetota bacterium]MDQ3533342.1 hypothetical protein [Actinomycetota bacterium]
MSDDLRRLFNRASIDFDTPAPDYRDVLQGGRRRLWTRRLGAVTFLVALLVGGGTLVTGLPWTNESTSGDSTQPAAQTTTQYVPDTRVASFAVRAIADAGLLDPKGTFNDYKGVEEATGGWQVNFDAFVCGSATCEPNSDGDTQLSVQVENGVLSIYDATGPLPDDATQRLLDFKEEPTPEGVDLQFPFLRISDSLDEGVSVIASPVWTGPIPARAALQVDCRLNILNEGGAVVFDRLLDEPLPQTEEQRAGTKYVWGLPESLRDEAAQASVVCQTTPS